MKFTVLFLFYVIFLMCCVNVKGSIPRNNTSSENEITTSSIPVQSSPEVINIQPGNCPNPDEARDPNGICRKSYIGSQSGNFNYTQDQEAFSFASIANVKTNGCPDPTHIRDPTGKCREKFD